MKKDDSLIERYEEIRRTLLARHRGAVWGLAVLRTKGMAAWAKSWREYSEGGVTHVPSYPSASSSPLVSPGSEEVVRVLAGMVWAIQQEACHDL